MDAHADEVRPPDEATHMEATALKVSAGLALGLSVVGIVWGLAAASQVILFDGLYSVIGFVLSWFGLRAAALVQRGPSLEYPFGREALAPLVVLVQALVLLGTFGYAAVDAIGVILAGGSQTELGSALVYSILTLSASGVAYAYMLRMQASSDLVAAEAMQWRASVVLGVAMTAGFAVAVALDRIGWSGVAPLWTRSSCWWPQP